MNKLVFTLLFIIISSIGISQDLLENKLMEIYTLKQTKFILDDSQQKKHYNNLVFNSFKIEEITPGKFKKENFNVLNSLEIKNIDGTTTTISPKELIESINNGSFNVLKLKLERDLDNSKTFVLGNTNYILKLQSVKSLSKLPKQ